MELLSTSVLEQKVHDAFKALHARAESEVDQLLGYERSASSVAQRLSKKLPERIAGRAQTLRDGTLKDLRAAAREALDDASDEHINAFRDAGCHKPLEEWKFEPSSFAVVAPTPSGLSWQTIGAAAVVFVAGIAVTFFATGYPRTDSGQRLLQIFGVGAAALVAAATAWLMRPSSAPGNAKDLLMEQVAAHLHREKPRVRDWLFEIKESYEDCADVYLPGDFSNTSDAPSA